MADETGPTTPRWPSDGTTAANSMWQPTVAGPTQAGWVNVPTHRPLEPDDPRVVGGYLLRARLGEGGMGRVYLSYTPGGRPVAIKVIRSEFADDPAFRRRFAQEVTTAQRVQGLYTAPVIDAGPDAAQPWLATAYVPGPSLQYAIGSWGPLPPDSVLVLVAGVAEALQSIHGAGVIHRDLKPSNVILAADGPRVIDFGVARAVDSTSMTQTGFRLGTPAFMSPEQVRGQSVTPAADIWSLGVLAAFASIGELPFGGGPDPAVPYRILEQEPNLTGCSEQVRGVAILCLEKDPARRPSPAAVIELCRAASTDTRLRMGEGWLPPPVAAEVHRIAAAPVPPVPPNPAAAAPPPTRRRGRALLVGAIVVALLAAGAITAVATGLFDKKTSGTASGSSSTPADPTTTTTTEPAARTTTTTSAKSSPTTSVSGSVPRVGSGPGSVVGQFDAINIASGFGIKFDQPTRAVEHTGNLYHDDYSGLQASGRAVILDAGQDATYETCTTDTRYVTDDRAIGKLPAGAAFCVIDDGRVALVTIKKVPDRGAPSRFYTVALTLWQGPST
jgi:serine/threonine protein kinase